PCAPHRRRLDTMKTVPILALAAGVALAVLAAGCNDDSSTSLTWTRADRMGIPAINTALIGAADKTRFNDGDPTSDAATFGPLVTNNITATRAAVDAVLGATEDSPGISAAALSAFVIPDIVTIDLSAPVQFPNGRRLQDDVT